MVWARRVLRPPILLQDLDRQDAGSHHPPSPEGNPYNESKQPAISRDRHANPAMYPTLRATLEALDRVQTRMYANAVIPVALAHEAVALPLGTGSHVLTLMAKQALGLP